MNDEEEASHGTPEYHGHGTEYYSPPSVEHLKRLEQGFDLEKEVLMKKRKTSSDRFDIPSESAEKQEIMQSIKQSLENLDEESESASFGREPPNIHELDDEPGKVYIWEWLSSDDTDRIERCMDDIRPRFEYANHIAIQGNVTVAQAVVQELSKDELRTLLEMTEVSDDQ